MSFEYSEFPSRKLQNEIFILGTLQVVVSLVCIFGYIALATLCVIQIMFFEGQAEAFLLYASLLHVGEGLLMAILGFSAILAAKYKSVDTDRGWKWKYLAYISIAVADAGIVMTGLSGYYLYLIPTMCRIIFQICVLWRMQKFEAECEKSGIPTHMKPQLNSSLPLKK